MLATSKIKTDIEVHKEDWHKLRLGKFTASRIGELMGKNSANGTFTAGAMSYIEDLAGEIITGKRSDQEIFTKAIDWGNAHEPEAIDEVAGILGKPAMRHNETGTTHFIILNDEYTSCTPDALLCETDPEHILNKEENSLKVSPLEVKCPFTFNSFIKLYRAQNPADLQEINKDYYWQILSQMLFTKSLKGYFAVYHPYFEKRVRIIEFITPDILYDFEKLQKTLHYAKVELENLVNYLKN